MESFEQAVRLSIKARTIVSAVILYSFLIYSHPFQLSVILFYNSIWFLSNKKAPAIDNIIKLRNSISLTLGQLIQSLSPLAGTAPFTKGSLCLA